MSVTGAFNEGRGFTPGDTTDSPTPLYSHGLARSMRAGGSPPATRRGFWF